MIFLPECFSSSNNKYFLLIEIILYNNQCSRYKFFCSGDDSGVGGIGVLLVEKWIEKVISVERIDHRLLCMGILVGKLIVNPLCAYSPQSGRPNEEKEKFFETLLSNIVKAPDDEILIVAGDLNGHVGKVLKATMVETGLVLGFLKELESLTCA